MTREKYFEIFDALGEGEPIEEEIPVEYPDLLYDVQEALNFYDKLRDEYDYMNGIYVGKNYAGLKDMLELAGVEPNDRLMMFDLIGIIDRNTIISSVDLLGWLNWIIFSK